MTTKKRESLTNARIAKGLNRIDLADLAEVSVEHIKSLEYGRVNPSIPLMFKLCKILDASPNELFMDIIHI